MTKTRKGRKGVSTLKEITVVNIANSIYECENQKQLSQFYHTVLFSPVKSTLLKAAKAGYLKWYPSLKPKVIKNLPATMDSTKKRHMASQISGVRPTKNNNSNQDHSMDNTPQEPGNQKTHSVFIAMEEAKGRKYTDQTSRFPRTSNRGVKILLQKYIDLIWQKEQFKHIKIISSQDSHHYQKNSQWDSGIVYYTNVT